jgi:DNA-directed RNA polymerase I, II, and III subunit RPABC2
MSDLEDYESDVEVPVDEDSDKEDKDPTTLSLKKSQPSSKIKSEVELSDDEFEDDDQSDIIDSDNEIDEQPDQLEEAPEEPTATNIDIIGANTLSPINSDVESDDEEYLQKFDTSNIFDNINKYHPECFTANSDEIEALSQVIREGNKIIDKNHKTNPILTKYEMTKILGQRTKQLNSGCAPYIDVPNNIIDSYLIAQMELKAKKIPVIIRRPISNQKSEYWKLEDLEQIY